MRGLPRAYGRVYNVGMAESDSRVRILEAAVREFSRVGCAGARVDTIAREAGVNKQLIYHYFGDKNGLYEAVTTAVLADRPVPIFQSRTEFADHFAHSCEELGRREVWTRLLMYEALEYTGGPVVAEERRKAFVGQVVRGVEKGQEAGIVDRCFAVRFLLLALTGAMMIPFLLPQLARLLTGLCPDDPEFKRQWTSTLFELARRLGTPAAKVDEPIS